MTAQATMQLKTPPLDQAHLYPLRFEPIYQYRVWGGRRLAGLLKAPLPDGGPFGEAWLLSDREDHPSRVADGALKGQTLGQVLQKWPEEMLGKLAGRFNRFPLLLKFLDARELLSVQVHPSDHQTAYLPEGERGKTEAWVVLEADDESLIYAGLKPSTTVDDLWRAIAARTVASHLASFKPRTGDSVLLPAGTVHSLGGLVVFEVQENSDVTFRLYDWDRLDAKTGQPRNLQVDQAMACIDMAQGAVRPSVPVVESAAPYLREELLLCEHFEVRRLSGASPFAVGTQGMPHVLVCIAGEGRLDHAGTGYAIGKGDVLLLPAALGTCLCRPTGSISLLEISIPKWI